MQGSNDGTNFVNIDSQSDRDFASRFQTNSYNVSNTQAYKYYRLNVTANNGAGILQLAELELFGPTKYTASFTANTGTDTTATIEVDGNYTYPNGTTGSSFVVDSLVINQVLAITSSDTADLDENTTEAVTITANDPSGETINYSISGGNDSSLFAIDSDMGVLSFNTAPDFENPGDSNSDNIYEVEVEVSNSSVSRIQNLLITVNDANDSPNITSSNTIILNENTTQVTTVTANDPDGDTLQG